MSHPYMDASLYQSKEGSHHAIKWKGEVYTTAQFAEVIGRTHHSLASALYYHDNDLGKALDALLKYQVKVNVGDVEYNSLRAAIEAASPNPYMRVIARLNAGWALQDAFYAPADTSMKMVDRLREYIVWPEKVTRVEASSGQQVLPW